MIGSIGAFRQDNIHNRTAEMGYYIGEPYCGNGCMTNAMKQACEYVFENTDMIRICNYSGTARFLRSKRPRITGDLPFRPKVDFPWQIA